MAKSALTVFSLLLLLPAGLSAHYGFDVGRSAPVALEEFFDPFGLEPEEGAWLRLRPVARHLPEEWRPGDLEALREFGALEYLAEVKALIELRERGFKLVAAMVHLGGPEHWLSGVRPGPNQRRRLPLDLREAYWRAFAAGYLYGGLFDAWEIENEPDIDFVADNAHVYASFHKAFALGLRDGEEARRGEREKAGRSGRVGSPAEELQSRILMAPLAMPPGPYLEELSRNGIWAYTDGFNYHYYGYPEDFSGVYRQFEEATRELTAKVSTGPEGERGLRNPRFVRRSWGLDSAAGADGRELPIFLTEFGYGYLRPEAASTLEGRQRQRAWFEQVLPQVAELGIEGPMIFFLPPYTSPSGIEFGLLALPEQAPWAESVEWTDPRFARQNAEAPLLPTPALEAVLRYARENPYEARNWTVPEAEASTLVLDFVGGTDAVQAKSFLGYFLTGKNLGEGVLEASGQGDLVLYNFSRRPAPGRLVVEFAGREVLRERLLLPPMGRLQVPLEMRVPAGAMVRHSLAARFVPDHPRRPAALLHTHIWPTPSGLESDPVFTFTAAAGSAEANRELLRNRPLATGEPSLGEQGKWLVTPGLSVSETVLGWSFEVASLPEEPLRPAIAELPLPDDFTFAPGDFLEFYFRSEGEEPVNFEAYFRTANGNLYSVWPRLWALPVWQEFLQAQENFTLALHGRGNLPWRFADNRPVALVFYLRPRTLPASVEVVFPQIVSINGGTTSE